MLISIGRRHTPEDLAGLLLECHARIRHFTALAVRLSSSDDGEERSGAAASVARYFGEALPLHVRDEEESLLPRLRGRGLEEAFDRMRDEHTEHAPRLAELVAITRAIAADESRFSEHAPRLRELSSALEKELALHLEQEEREIIPRIAALLTKDEQRAVIDEMRARRA